MPVGSTPATIRYAPICPWWRKRYCFSWVTAVMTRGVRPVDRAWRARFEEIREVVKSVSAAVPAPAHLTHQIPKSEEDK